MSTLTYLVEICENVVLGPKLVQITIEKVAVAKEKLRSAHFRQKSYANKHIRTLEFKLSEKNVFLKGFLGREFGNLD